MAKVDKFTRDLAEITTIIERGTFTSAERARLLSLYNVSVHNSGKIKGISSFDGSAVHCNFCKAMRKAAENDSTMICGDCYIMELDKLRANMSPRHWLNQLIMSKTLYTIKELATLYIPTKLIRVHADGDFENSTEARNMLRLAKAHKGNRVAIWFKNKAAMKEAIATEGKPRNVIIIYSACRLNENPKNVFEEMPFVDYTFTVYVDKASTQAAIASGANECNGRHCDECGYKCYMGTWRKGSNIAEYLRNVNKDKRAEKVNAVKARGLYNA